MSTERLAIVGDVHGNALRLERALSYLAESDRRVVFVGDYINRGPNSRDVLDLLASASESNKGSMILLRGNHEQALLSLLSDGSPGRFLMSGGLRTIRNYYPDPPPDVMDRFRAEFPKHHLDLLASTRSYFENDDVLISHTGYDPRRPTARDARTMVYTAHPEILLPNSARLHKQLVFGHYVQSSRKPLDLGWAACIDTGCGTLDDAPLTVMLFPERTFVQF